MYSKIAMEGVKLEVCCLIIADFYRKNLVKEKSYIVRHFKCMGYKKKQILYRDEEGR